MTTRSVLIVFAAIIASHKVSESHSRSPGLAEISEPSSSLNQGVR